MAAHKSEMMDAIEALAKAKDISVDQIVSAVEEGCKAAYRKYTKRAANAPMNLSVVISREHDVQIFARKVVSEEVEDESQQISLEDAHKIRGNYELGDIVEIDVTPADFGLTASAESITGGDANQNAEIARGILSGKISGVMRDVLLANSAASLHVAGKADSITEGVKLAADSIDSGAALKKLTAMVAFTQSC